MPRAIVNDADIPGGKIELEYETFGSPTDPPILLIMGFTAQLTLWPEELCRRLADGGRFVIRFDNRVCGLSSKFDGVNVDLPGVIGSVMSEGATPMPPVPYTLSDMAADAAGLLDHLGLDAAHVVGASMGGMIAQTFAIDLPRRTLTLTSIMSMTGEPEYGQSTPEAGAALLAPPPIERQAYIDASSTFMTWHSKKYRDAEKSRADAARDYDRSFYPQGAPRQLGAIYASGSRAEGLQALRTPTLVIHGRDDTLITPPGGFRTAELVDGSTLLYVSDMGHDLPAPLIPAIADAILSHTSRLAAVSK